MRLGIVSGGFDPVHVGHIRMFKEAKKYCSKLVVIVNNDNWLVNKKGKPFMNEQERMDILVALDCVDFVMISTHRKMSDFKTKSIMFDTSVTAELHKLIHDWQFIVNEFVFMNGGDRKEGNIPEYDFCEKNKIKMMFNIGGGKIQSSSDLVKKSKVKK